ncbi:MAG: hypothetical protein ACKOB0_08100, partial [Chthoniobacterales bacterium]
PARATDQWELEVDTIVTLGVEEGAVRGTITLKKGTPVELLPESTAQVAKISHAGLVFEMPRGDALQEAFDTLYPEGARAANSVFDVDAWQKRRSLPAEQARWLPLPPRPNEPRQKHWNPAGFFAVPEHLPHDSGGASEPPADFAWDRTLIIPGRFAYLNLPFILQKRGGICVGAAGVNVVRYLRPEMKVTADEFFRMLTDKPNAGSYDELVAGLGNLGLPAEKIKLSRAKLPAVLRRLRTSLDANLPVLISNPQHMVLVNGYDAAAKKIFLWEQWGAGKIINGMPKGHFEVPDSQLSSRYDTVVFCRMVRCEPADNIKRALEDSAGKTDDLRLHRYFPIARDFYSPGHETRSIEGSMGAVLGSGRIVLVPQGESVLCVLPGMG